MASGPITSWQIDRGKMGTVADFIFLGSKIAADGDCCYENKRLLLLGRKAMTNVANVFIKKQRQRYVQSKLWFIQWSCMDMRVGS